MSGVVLKRIARFYFSFWPVFLVCIPLSVFVFRSPAAAVPHSTGYWTIQFLGLAGHNAMNSTWWFNSLILPLYVLSPMLYMAGKRTPLLTLLLAMTVNTWQLKLGVDLAIYLPVYLWGMYWYLYRRQTARWLNRLPTGCAEVAAILLVAVASIALLFVGAPVFSKGILLYAVMTVLTAFIAVTTLKRAPWLRSILQFLGRHSANTYLVHSFLFYYWWPEFFYSLRYPLVIFAALMGASVLFSTVLEWVKKVLGYGRVQNWVVDKINFLPNIN